jgi:hypothetical protein
MMLTTGTRFFRGQVLWVIITLVPSVMTGCGGGSSAPAPVEQEVIAGKVIDGYLEGAVVCADLNGNGQCDGSEAQARSNPDGSYQLSVPKGSTAPLLAEVIAGQARDSDAGGGTVDRSFRMASPSRAYSTNITPYTTLVHLSGERNYPLAEDIVRNIVGLPPRFAINVDNAAVPGSLTQLTGKSVVVALKALGLAFDMTGAGALGQLASQLPSALSALPELRIVTKDGAPIDSKEVYVDATYALTNPAVSSQPVALNGKIRGRGHSTWDLPKKPYKVQFTNDASYAGIPDFLGMKKNRNWALLADYNDKTLMRNQLALALANSSVFNDGLKWTSSGQHLEVYVNGEYAGVYLMTEDIRIDPNRLAIKKMSTSPTVNDLDGGYIVEVDWRLDCYNQGDLNLQHRTPQGVPICVDTPDESAITQAQLAYIKDLLDGTEANLYAQNRIDGINPASFVDWYLLNELFRNNDAVFFSSVFMWKDSASATNPLDRVLNLGPIWDFDISAGNVNYNDNWNIEGCWVSRSTPPLSNWIAKLFDNPAFLDLSLSRWKAKRAALRTFVNASIDTYAARLASAQQRNFARWPVLGVQLSGHYVFPTYEAEVEFLRTFLNQRMTWLDRAYESPDSFRAMCK